MTLMSGGGMPDLAGLLGGTMGGQTHPEQDQQSPTPKGPRNSHLPPLSAIPARRKSNDLIDQDEAPALAKRKKTTHFSPKSVANAGLKMAKTPHRKSEAFTSTFAKAIAEGEMVKETPISPAETNYGTAPILTSTPKDFRGGWGQAPGTARRMAMPPLSSAVEEGDVTVGDVDEEEALLAAAKSVRWDDPDETCD